MKLATLLIPAYLPRAYVGATPTPYQSGTVDKFEREIVLMSPLVVRHANAVRIMPDRVGRFAHQQVVTEYDFMWEANADSLGKAIALALKSFGLEKVLVVCAGEVEEIDLAGAAELETGLHPWCEE
jgi:hypothetical protein